MNKDKIHFPPVFCRRVVENTGVGRTTRSDMYRYRQDATTRSDMYRYSKDATTRSDMYRYSKNATTRSDMYSVQQD